MISAWWLFLIIPVSVIFGYFTAALMLITKEFPNDSDKKKHF